MNKVKNLGPKKLIGIGAVIFVLIALPIILFQTQKSQDVRQRASGATPGTGDTKIYLSPDTLQIPKNGTFTTELKLNTKTKIVTNITAEIIYDSSKYTYNSKQNGPLFDTVTANPIASSRIRILAEADPTNPIPAGSDITVATLSFTAKDQLGDGAITFAESPLIIAGKNGTSIVSYTTEAPAVSYTIIDQSSTTPTVTTIAATDITATGATLKANVVTQTLTGVTTTYVYSPTTNDCSRMSFSTPIKDIAAGPTTTTLDATPITGLTPSTTYHYCARAKLSNSTTTYAVGAPMSFTTLAQTTNTSTPTPTPRPLGSTCTQDEQCASNKCAPETTQPRVCIPYLTTTPSPTPTNPPGPQSSTGAKSPKTVSQTNTAGTSNNANWSNMDNVKVSDNQKAQSITQTSTSSTSNTLIAKNFEFNIPTDSTIKGVTIEVEQNTTSSPGSRTYQLGLTKDGNSIVGKKISSTTSWSRTEEYKTYGGAVDMWETTLTTAEVNSPNFGIGLAVKGATGISTSTAQVDHIRVTVHYVENTPEAATATPSNTPIPLSCDPVKTGGSSNIIDIDDYNLWVEEYTRVKTTQLTDCFKKDGKIDLLDFQVWKNIAILKTTPAF